MISMNSYGLALMQKGMNTSNAASAQVLESDGDPMAVAEASMGLSQGKVEVALGAWLVKQQNELMETSLQIFGIGGKYSGLA